MRRRLIPLITMTSLILTACGGADSPASQPAAISGAAAGQPLFALNCGECHGQDGTGTDEAPGIGGHDAEEVIEQVRNPVGDMEAIASEALSDADLQLIAEFVASLPGEEAHPEISPSEEERVHLVAAYEAIEDYEDMDREAAINHLGQALAIATDEAAIAIYEELLEAVETGKSGTTRHELKELLGLEEGH